jgi:hypothetical protein
MALTFARGAGGDGWELESERVALADVDEDDDEVNDADENGCGNEGKGWRIGTNLGQRNGLRGNGLATGGRTKKI